MNGYGYFTWQDGRTYEGNYANDKRSGHGIYTLTNGKRYDGQWRNGQQDGYGYVDDGKNTDRKIGKWDQGTRVSWVPKKEGDSVPEEVLKSL